MILFDYEKTGGAYGNRHCCQAFENCIYDYNLLDLAYAISIFTCNRGQVFERLGRVLCNPYWQYIFSDSKVTHLPFPTSDHCGFWIQMIGDGQRKTKPFKFFGTMA